MNIKYRWDFIMVKTCVRVCSFRDLVTADGEAMRTRTLVR